MRFEAAVAPVSCVCCANVLVCMSAYVCACEQKRPHVFMCVLCVRYCILFDVYFRLQQIRARLSFCGAIELFVLICHYNYQRFRLSELGITKLNNKFLY